VWKVARENQGRLEICPNRIILPLSWRGRNSLKRADADHRFFDMLRMSGSKQATGIPAEAGIQIGRVGQLWLDQGILDSSPSAEGLEGRWRPTQKAEG